MNPAWWPPLLLALPGWLAARRWLPSFDAAGRLGVGILLGLAGGPLLLFLAHLLGMPLDRLPVLLLLGAALVGVSSGLWPRVAPPTDGSRPLRPADPPWLPAEILLVGLIVLLVGASAWKGAFYPISATDAHSYDGRARWIVAEKTLDLSVYAAIKATGATNISYPPVYPLDLALGYWVGGVEGKVVDSWFFVGILLVVYGTLRRGLPRIGALLGTLLLASTPEIWNHASLALINLPSMAFLSAAFLVAADLRCVEDDRRSGRGGFWLAGLLAAGAAGVRSDAALLTLAGAIVLLARAPRRISSGLALVLPALTVTIAWQLYLRLRLGLAGGEPFRSGWLAESAIILGVGRSLLDVVFFAPLFAYVFHALVLALLVTLVGRALRAPWASGPLSPAGRPLALLLAWSITLVALFQALDLKFGGGLDEILRTSFKRTCFYLVPPAIVGLLLLPPVRNGLMAFDRWQRESR